MGKGKCDKNGFDDEDLLGRKLDEAAEICATYGYTMRVTRKNNHACIVTRDYRPDRINVGIVNDLVSEVRGIG